MPERGTFTGEVILGWRRFWAHSWKLKGPVLAVSALIVIGLVAAAASTPSEVVDEGKAPASADGPSAFQSDDRDDTPTRTPRATNTPEATRTPTSTATPRPPTVTPTPAPPTATPVPPGYSFGTGKKVVGTDLVAGATYRTRTSNQGCYWERLSGFGGTIAEIEANDNTNGPAMVTIGASDVGFNSARCGTWTRDISAITSDPSAPFKGDGTFIVGVDIAPGTWRSSGGTTCYWQRMRSFSGDLSDIIANDNETGDAIVTISSSDAGFSSARCGTWTKQ